MRYDAQFETKGKSKTNTFLNAFKSFLKIIPGAPKNIAKCEVSDLWADVMGDEVVNRTESIRLADSGVLFVRIASPCLKNELINKRDAILTELQSKNPYINSIYWY